VCRRISGSARPVGQPPFVPTAAERVFVSTMAGVKMSAEEICKVIGASRGVDAVSGKAISRATLYRHFKSEMSSGRALLKTKIVAGWHRAIDEGQNWAIQFGLRTVLGLRDGAGVPALPHEVGDEQRPSIQVTFVRPDPNDPRFRDDPPQLERPVRYDPAPPGQRLLPAPTDRPMQDLSIRKRGSWMD
jgi:hypothetical protein